MAEIHYEKVADPRIVQKEQRYAVITGGANNSQSPYLVISATQSQHSFQVNIPSLQTFVDRNVLWNSDVYQSFTAAPTASNTGVAASAPSTVAITAPQYVATPGQDFALCAFPLMSMTSTLQATLNDTSVTANSDVLKEVLRLRDFKKNRIASSCPKIMDRYAVNSDGADTVASALGGFNNFVGEGSTPNGAWWNLVYCNSQGQALVGGVNALGQVGAYLTTVPGVYQMFLNGIPIRTPGIGAYASTTLMLQALTGVVGAQPAADTFYTIYLKWSTTESIVLSPFIFASGAEYEETGLFGINAMSLIFNIDAGSAARVIRASGDVSISNVQFYGSAFANSRLMVSYITPPLSIPLPALSSVPGLEFPRWTQAGYAAIPAGTSQQLSSQTLVLPYCPDAIIVACKPSFTQSPALAAAPNDYADFYLPLDYATNNPFSLSFDNRPGILSTATHAQLHKMSLAAGLNVDYEQFSGFAYNASNDATVSPVKALTGAPLVLRFGIDIPLAPGVAPGVVSNFVVQYQVTVRNTLTVPVTVAAAAGALTFTVGAVVSGAAFDTVTPTAADVV